MGIDPTNIKVTNKTSKMLEIEVSHKLWSEEGNDIDFDRNNSVRIQLCYNFGSLF